MKENLIMVFLMNKETKKVNVLNLVFANKEAFSYWYDKRIKGDPSMKCYEVLYQEVIPYTKLGLMSYYEKQ